MERDTGRQREEGGRGGAEGEAVERDTGRQREEGGRGGAVVRETGGA